MVKESWLFAWFCDWRVLVIVHPRPGKAAMRDRRCPQESEGLPPETRWCRAPEEREMREWLARQQLLLSAGRSYYDVQRKKQAAETKAGVELHFEIIPVSLRDCSKWQRDSRLIPYLSYTWVSFDLPNISQPSEANLPPLSERSFWTLPIELPCSPGFQDSLCFLPAMMNEGSACRVESRPGGRQPALQRFSFWGQIWP